MFATFSGLMYTRKMPSGNWQVIVEYRGVVRRSSAPTRSEAVQRGAELLVDLGSTPAAVSDRVTVAVVLADHFASNKERWSPQYAGDFHRITARLPEAFLAMNAATVTSADIAGLYRNLMRAGMSDHRLQRLQGFLSGAFKRAGVNGWVRSNPCTGVTTPQPSPADLVVPTAVQVSTIVAAASDPVEHLFLRVAAITGARRGELVGLQWDDISTDRLEVVIRRARSLDATGVPFTGPGKTGRKGHRVLSLDPTTISDLAVLHAEQRPLADANRLPEPVWIFSPDAGATPWPPDYATDIFRAAAETAQVAGVRLHDLRHYVATSMLQDGESPIDVANQLGDTVQTVLRTYAHFMPGRGRDAAMRRAQGLG
ncbi:MAG: site-specific integrase [Marinosulfonomonas sp.]|nr:site-specific integrase [Marinosulfonomonas sp.]